jgi:uncharacterized protein YjiS (DUF1127 family)
MLGKQAVGRCLPRLCLARVALTFVWQFIDQDRACEYLCEVDPLTLRSYLSSVSQRGGLYALPTLLFGSKTLKVCGSMDANRHMNEFDFRLPVLPARRKSWLARAAAEVKVGLDRMRERQRVIRQLEAMSDRDLADLGISRYDIPRVLDPEFAKERAFGNS